MRNAYINLALPLYVFSEPLAPLFNVDKEYDEIMMGPVKVIPGKFSCWDKEHIDGPQTIQQLVDLYKAKYKVKLSMICAGSTPLYNSWGQDMKSRMGKEVI